MMTLQDYDRFSLADPVLFELPENYPDDGERLAAAARTPPPGWTRTEHGWWVRLCPDAPGLPEQGWKIHVSVTPAAVTEAVDLVWDHAVRHALAFDFIRSVATARALNGVHADRFTSGDLIILHPADDTALTRALGELTALLDGAPGPYVLGGLRHRSGPLHTRYAATEGTGSAPVLRTPDGTLVPDRRRPLFRRPDWLPLPAVLRPDLEALHAPPDGELPFTVRRALRFTNGGGTYLATDRRTGEQVVLREARPHAGLDRRGEDAVTRLGRERAALERLSGLDRVPRTVGHHVHGGHHFLAVEHIEGTSLAEAAALAFPLTSEERAEKEAAAYTAWALATLDALGRALRELHSRGLRLGELHPKNVFLRPDGRVVLVDLATATDLTDDRAPALGDPAHTAPDGLRGADATAYLLNLLCLWLFLPVPHDGPAKLRTLTAAVDGTYPLPPGFGTALLTGLCPADRPVPYDHAGALLAAPEPDWPAIRDSLVAGIHAMATPGRADRLFPGTPTGPRSIGGHAFAYGAAGVLHALHRVGAGIPEEYVAWLLAAVERDRAPRPGLHDGLHGVALTLDQLGHREDALELLDRCRADAARVTCPDLASGAAGIALNQLRFARVTGDGSLRDEALRTAERLAALVASGPLAPRPGAPAPYGLLHGGAGIALLFLRLHEETRDPHWLDAADTALGHDLDRCALLPDGHLVLFDGTHRLPYLHGGSTGLAFALRHLLRHRPDPARATTLGTILHTCRALYVRNSGLVRGRAGGIAVLAATGAPQDDAETRARIRTQVHRLAWHARSYRGRLAFPGFRSLRLAADLATGSAGVLLALSSAFEGTGPVLPYLDPRFPSLAEGGRR
ncbi:class III lanthionine synthetase LanKC [Streptomyces blastmyceticus]|uniref:Class III lanthionine synthetase LanKC n=1 Tax=Streptomyces blastmyceticus TaxID=68180 RepID=A0ABN0XK49_9ACTN